MTSLLISWANFINWLGFVYEFDPLSIVLLTSPFFWRFLQSDQNGFSRASSTLPVSKVTFFQWKKTGLHNFLKRWKVFQQMLPQDLFFKIGSKIRLCFQGKTNLITKWSWKEKHTENVSRKRVQKRVFVIGTPLNIPANVQIKCSCFTLCKQ